MTSTNNNTSISAQVDERKKKWGNDIYAFDAYANKDKYADYGYSSADDFMAAYKNDLDYVTRFDTATLAKQEAEQAAQKAESQKLQYADTRRQLMEKYIPETLLAQGVANTGYTADALLKAENNYNQYATNAMNTRAEAEQNILKDYQTTLKNMQKDYTDTAYKNFLEQNERESASAEEEKEQNKEADYVKIIDNAMLFVVNLGYDLDKIKNYAIKQGASEDIYPMLEDRYNKYIQSLKDDFTTNIQSFIDENPVQSWDDVKAKAESLGADESQLKETESYYNKTKSKAIVDWAKRLMDDEKNVYTLDDILFKANEYAPSDETISEITNEYNKRFAHQQDKNKEALYNEAVNIVNTTPDIKWNDVVYAYGDLDDDAMNDLYEVFENRLIHEAQSAIEGDELVTLDDLIYSAKQRGANEETIAKITNMYNNAVSEYQAENYNTLLNDIDSGKISEVSQIDDLVNNGGINEVQGAAAKYELTGKVDHLIYTPPPRKNYSTSATWVDGDGGQLRPGVNTDNFSVQYNGKTYKVEHRAGAGKAASEYAQSVGIPDKQVFMYDGNLCIKWGDHAYLLGGRTLNSAGYDNLLEAVRSEYEAAAEEAIEYDPQGNWIAIGDDHIDIVEDPDYNGRKEMSIEIVNDPAAKDLAKHYKDNEVFIVGDAAYVKRSDGSVIRITGSGFVRKGDGTKEKVQVVDWIKERVAI